MTRCVTLPLKRRTAAVSGDTGVIVACLQSVCKYTGRQWIRIGSRLQEKPTLPKRSIAGVRGHSMRTPAQAALAQACCPSVEISYARVVWIRCQSCATRSPRKSTLRLWRHPEWASWHRVGKTISEQASENRLLEVSYDRLAGVHHIGASWMAQT